MRKHQWRTCTDLADMLLSLRSLRVSPRKLRLFGCECCRRIWELIPDARSRNAVVVAERYAEGQVGETVLAEALTAASAALPPFGQAPAPPHSDLHALRACVNVSREKAGEATTAWYGVVSARQMQRMLEAGEQLPALPSHPLISLTMREEQQAIIAILRDLFWNPFRRLPFNPAWLTSDVLALARGIYEERAFDRMPILADALQDAGCTNEEVLNHCRDANQVHVRGCWVVDMLLGKE